MAHGMKQGTFCSPPKIFGKTPLKLGAAWMAGKAIWPMLELFSNPKMALAWLNVTSF
jgi:hypothetical protein